MTFTEPQLRLLKAAINFRLAKLPTSSGFRTEAHQLIVDGLLVDGPDGDLVVSDVVQFWLNAQGHTESDRAGGLATATLR